MTMKVDTTIGLNDEAPVFSIFADPYNGLVLLTRQSGSGGQLQIIGTREQLKQFSDVIRAACSVEPEVATVNEEVPVG